MDCLEPELNVIRLNTGKCRERGEKMKLEEKRDLLFGDGMHFFLFFSTFSFCPSFLISDPNLSSNPNLDICIFCLFLLFTTGWRFYDSFYTHTPVDKMCASASTRTNDEAHTLSHVRGCTQPNRSIQSGHGKFWALFQRPPRDF